MRNEELVFWLRHLDLPECHDALTAALRDKLAAALEADDATIAALERQLTAADALPLNIVVNLTEFRPTDDKIEDAQNWYAAYCKQYPKRFEGDLDA